PFPGSPWLSLAIPWALVMGMLTWRGYVARRRREALLQLGKAVEAAEFSDWPKVGQITRALLARPLAPESARVQAILLLAGATERTHQYDVSELLFESILSERRGDAVQLHQATLGLAAVKLRSEQLTDAVQILNRMRLTELPPILRAG